MEGLKRGGDVVVALQGDYGKPRPAVVVQSDLFDAHSSVAILPLTSEILAAPLFRITVDPAAGNGLRVRSQVMVDKPYTVAKDKIGGRIGRLDEQTMLQVNRSMMVWLGLP
ncbi:MAG: type II toxin-antitoxin system PemK/MazF family toxin [Betaproteobacteria bacterium]